MAGGIAPFPYATSADVRNIADLVKADLTSRKMPPWPASDACAQYSPDASLTDAQLALFVSWLDSGMLEGDPKDFVPLSEPQNALSRVDLTVPMRQAFTPTETPDQYRCFVLDWPLTDTAYITGYALEPGQPSMIHHADIFYIKPEDAAEFQANDTGDGYECYTVPVLEGGWIGTFVPGNRGVDFPEESGIQILPGSKIFIQTHYNTGLTGFLPDLSKLNLSVATVVHHRGAVIALADTNWIDNGTMDIPAYQQDVEHSYQLDPTPFLSVLANPTFVDGKAVNVWAGTLHMHQMGSKGGLELIHADGTHDCIVDIPQWSFAWQLPYTLATPKVLNPGDQLSVDCHWDNSAANQPIVNGVQRVPEDLNWGNRTTDEMCVGGIYLTQ